jgi:hypothetical protein
MSTPRLVRHRSAAGSATSTGSASDRSLLAALVVVGACKRAHRSKTAVAATQVREPTAAVAATPTLASAAAAAKRVNLQTTAAAEAPIVPTLSGNAPSLDVSTDRETLTDDGAPQGRKCAVLGCSTEVSCMLVPLACNYVFCAPCLEAIGIRSAQLAADNTMAQPFRSYRESLLK